MNRANSHITQAFVDRLVRDRPDATGGEILAVFEPAHRLAAQALLRWPPGPRRPSVTDEPLRVPGKIERVHTPLVRDLEHRLAQGPANPRPTGRVNVGTIPAYPGDPSED